ncbi:hypothetical protein BDA99DRAFT_595156 [Phascolomyces articulosus]|uniref:Actin-like ATPase domain-containing protein n=1 Tax=Phascolomyces articulosus TaxID=60185 RepID=A0AAD5KNM2_9FUNG|nr:hypothetical protein BDA99DRAFT_595156 [Phascolomyces articulosus]
MLRSNPQQPPQDYKVVIAYDFGTTYSGAAYAFTHSTPTEVFDVLNWPQKGGYYFPKVPTLSVYPRHNQQKDTQSPERSTLTEWGHGAKKAMLKPHADKRNILLSRFKLHLDESLNNTPIENGLTPVQVVADYLSALHQHTLNELKIGFANSYHPDTFRYCLTVPAVWSDKAKSLMRQAAIKAGLILPSDPPDRLVLISEPEAAALYCEETMADQVQLKDNDRIMICDAGGGTVDLIVFTVNIVGNIQSSTRKKRQLKEVTKGMGESCGSVFLDKKFHELLKTKLGPHVIEKMNLREMNGLMEYFTETIKPDFNGVDDFYLELPRSVKVEELPENVREEDEDGYLDEAILKLSSQELKEQVFDPVVNKVLSLIERQYQQIPDGRLDFLFLVGGFGSSKYLYERIKNIFQGTKVNHIVCPAERAALAVVRGAVYHGVYPQVVVSRISRRSYGINLGMDYDANIDPPSKRAVRPDGRVICEDRFALFVKKENELPVDYCIERQGYVYYGTKTVDDIGLYATENDSIPRYCDEPGVYRTATILVPIPTVPGMNMNDHLYYTIR